MREIGWEQEDGEKEEKAQTGTGNERPT